MSHCYFSGHGSFQRLRTNLVTIVPGETEGAIEALGKYEGVDVQILAKILIEDTKDSYRAEIYPGTRTHVQNTTLQ